jgi:hypothetical protein
VTKNITLSVHQSTLKTVRRLAAQRDTTVNGLVRKYLEELAGQSKQRANARRELVKFIPKVRTKIGSIRWSREELHAR